MANGNSPLTKQNPLNADNRCSAYCVSNSFEQKELIEYAHRKGQVLVYKNANVIHLALKESKGDIFFFAYGVIVTWGLLREAEEDIIQEIQHFSLLPVEKIDFDHYLYYIGSTAKINGNEIILPINGVMEKLAISHALAQSVKLGVFEYIVFNTIKKAKYIPSNLAIKGKIPLSRRKMTKMMGQLFLERSMINLHTDILDTPDFFWDHSELEPLYQMVNKDLELSSRTQVLNKRLDVLSDLLDMLRNELNHRHSLTLEWIIIMLIFVEIVISILKDILHWL